LSGPPDGDGTRKPAADGGREIYLEFHPIGNSVKVVAVDSVTGLEISIVGPVTAARRTLEQNAIRKLKYMLDKGRTE
jgi:hypothetical protein